MTPNELEQVSKDTNRAIFVLTKFNAEHGVTTSEQFSLVTAAFNLGREFERDHDSTES